MFMEMGPIEFKVSILFFSNVGTFPHKREIETKTPNLYKDLTFKKETRKLFMMGCLFA